MAAGFFSFLFQHTQDLKASFPFPFPFPEQPIRGGSCFTDGCCTNHPSFFSSSTTTRSTNNLFTTPFFKASPCDPSTRNRQGLPNRQNKHGCSKATAPFQLSTTSRKLHKPPLLKRPFHFATPSPLKRPFHFQASTFPAQAPVVGRSPQTDAPFSNAARTKKPPF